MTNFPPVLVDANGVPVSSGYKPNDTWHALQLSTWTKSDLVGSNTSGPVVMQTLVQEWLMTELLFSATTGKLVTATNANLIMGASLFNPALSGKAILVVSARVMQSAGGADAHLNLTTTDPAFAQSATPTNLAAGGLSSVLTTSFTFPAAAAIASVTVSGTQIDTAMLPGLSTVEVLPPNMGILLPLGAANGVVLYTTVATAGGAYAMTFRWVELTL